MSEKEKPLPRPPKTPFGKRRFDEWEESAPLIADRMAAAMAQGKLDEFMKDEMPDNDYARTLAAIMMGMTGMAPPGGMPSAGGKIEEGHSGKGEGVKPSEEVRSGQPSEDVINAARAGDVKGLMEILAREHKKRMPESGSDLAEEKEIQDSPGLSDIERKTLDQILRIASENNVSVDWIVLRALKLYIQEYQKTGRL